jgi:hypothetical protein
LSGDSAVEAVRKSHVPKEKLEIFFIIYATESTNGIIK